MNNRIKDVRKALKMTQQAFGDRLHLSKNYIYLIESGNNPVTDKLIFSICREFGVNETWLLTGNGEMFAPLTEEQEIAQILSAVIKDDSYFLQELIKMVTKLSPETINELTESLIIFADNLKKKSHPED